MDSDLPVRFGATVRALRSDQGISQERLAVLAGVDRAYMGGIERGQRNPTLTTIDRVAHGLGLAMSDLLKAVEQHPSSG